MAPAHGFRVEVSTQPDSGFGLWEETHPEAVVSRVESGPCAIVVEGTAFAGESAALCGWKDDDPRGEWSAGVQFRG